MKWIFSIVALAIFASTSCIGDPSLIPPPHQGTADADSDTDADADLDGDGDGQTDLSIITEDVTDITDHSMLLRGQWTGTTADEHGFCWSTDHSTPLENCQDLGPLTESATFEFELTSLRAGTAVQHFAYVLVDDQRLTGQTRAVTTNAPPVEDLHAASLFGSVELSWQPHPDAVAFEILRDDTPLETGALLQCEDSRCTFIDDTVQGPTSPDPGPPANFTASQGDHLDRVELSWQAPAAETPSYSYDVIAVYNSTQSHAAETQGQSASFDIQGYRIEFYDASNPDFSTLIELDASANAHDDFSAPAPELSATISASQGTSEEVVFLEASDLSVSPQERHYRVVLLATDDGDLKEYETDWVQGYRNATPEDIHIQWEHSAGNNIPFEPLPDLDGEFTTADESAPEDGSGRFYRALLSLDADLSSDFNPLVALPNQTGLWGFRAVPVRILYGLNEGGVRLIRSDDPDDTPLAFHDDEARMNALAMMPDNTFAAGSIAQSVIQSGVPNWDPGTVFRSPFTSNGSIGSDAWTWSPITLSSSIHDLAVMGDKIIASIGDNSVRLFSSTTSNTNNPVGSQTNRSAAPLLAATPSYFYTAAETALTLYDFNGSSIGARTLNAPIRHIATGLNNSVVLLLNDGTLLKTNLTNSDADITVAQVQTNQSFTGLTITPQDAIYVAAGATLYRFDLNDPNTNWEITTTDSSNNATLITSLATDAYGRSYVATEANEVLFVDPDGTITHRHNTGNNFPVSISVDRDTYGAFGNLWNPYR